MVPPALKQGVVPPCPSLHMALTVFPLASRSELTTSTPNQLNGAYPTRCSIELQLLKTMVVSPASPESCRISALLLEKLRPTSQLRPELSTSLR